MATIQQNTISATVPDSVSDYMRTKSDAVLSILVINYIDKIFQRNKLSSSINWTIFLVVSLPVFLDGFMVALGVHISPERSLFFLFDLMMNYCLFKFPCMAYKKFIDLCSIVDTVLIDANSRKRFISSLGRILNKKKQIFCSVFGVIIGEVSFLVDVYYGARFDLAEKSFFLFGSHLDYILMGALGANTLYWLVHVPLFCNGLYKYDVKLNFVDPKSSKIMRDTSGLLLYCTNLAVAGAILYISRFYVNVIFFPGSKYEWIVFIVALVYSLLVIFWMLFSQILISKIIQREKWRIFDRISSEINNQCEVMFDAGSKYVDIMALDAKISILKKANDGFVGTGVVSFLVKLWPSIISLIPVILSNMKYFGYIKF